MKPCAPLLTLLVFFSTAGIREARATLIDFNSLGNGEIVENQFAGLGVTISAVNFIRTYHLASTFDTTATGTEDPDLEDPWSGGNLPSDTLLGNLLIISENPEDTGNPGFVTEPDDEGGRRTNDSTGELIFDFDMPIDELSFAVVDIEPGHEVDNSSVALYSGATLLLSIPFSSLPGSPTYGDNYANQIGTIAAADYSIDAWDRVKIILGGSGGVDNIYFRKVPEPSTLAFLGTGLFGLVALARRRR